jgi:hypothetical protein
MAMHALFHRINKPDLCCAAPHDAPMPAFLRKPGWEFVEVFDENSPPSGFNADAARYSVQLQGFYVFHAFSPLRDRYNRQ